MTGETDNLFAEIELPVPQKAVQLFDSREDWHLNTSRNYIPSGWQWDWYADGYKTAADLLVEHVDKTSSDQDILLYPVVFLYRHYVELRLKELLLLSSSYLDEPVAGVPPKHDLLELWRAVRPKLERVWPEAEYHDDVGDILRQFCEIDAGSCAFRYPVTRDGTPTLTEADPHINLGRVKDAITGISSVLDGSSIGLREYLQMKSEM
jgi:hypothetical protein